MTAKIATYPHINQFELYNTFIDRNEPLLVTDQFEALPSWSPALLAKEASECTVEVNMCDFKTHHLQRMK